MPFCEHCGAHLAEGAAACGSCGRASGKPPAAGPPLPPPGYTRQPDPARAPRPQPPVAPRRPTAAIPPRGFPAAAVPPLAAAIALLVTTAYATTYELVELGEIYSVDWFLTGAAPSVLSSPFSSYAPFGGDWAIAIPFTAVLLSTLLLASLTKTGIGQRLAIGGLVFAPTVLFTILLTLLNFAVVGPDVYVGLGEDLAREATGATIVGLLGGLLGALLSLAIRPPARSPTLG